MGKLKRKLKGKLKGITKAVVSGGGSIIKKKIDNSKNPAAKVLKNVVTGGVASIADKAKESGKTGKIVKAIVTGGGSVIKSKIDNSKNPAAKVLKNVVTGGVASIADKVKGKGFAAKAVEKTPSAISQKIAMKPLTEDGQARKALSALNSAKKAKEKLINKRVNGKLVSSQPINGAERLQNVSKFISKLPSHLQGKIATNLLAVKKSDVTTKAGNYVKEKALIDTLDNDDLASNLMKDKLIASQNLSDVANESADNDESQDTETDSDDSEQPKDNNKMFILIVAAVVLFFLFKKK
jgi:hypothetical protein